VFFGVSVFNDVVETTNQAPIAEAIQQAMQTAAWGVGLIGAGVAILAALGLAIRVYRSVTSLFEYPITTVGTFRSVDYTAAGDLDEETDRECLNCGVETSYYVRSDWRHEQVVGGIVVDVLDEGTHYDCAACASDPVVASLRAQADDPESIDGLDELVVDEEPGADLEDLDDEQLDEALGWIDMGADVDEAVREVAG
jgi:hypothetical protein